MHIAKIAFILSLTLATLIFAGDVQAQNGVISIDHVTNQFTSTQLNAGHLHQVSIRYDASALSANGYWVGSNGFEIYSPDGADWGFFKGYAGPLLETAGDRGTLTVFAKHYNFDGSTWSRTGNYGSDPAGGSTGSTTRAGFYLATISLFSDAGYAGGTDDDIAVILEFTTSLANVFQTICIDTCNQIVAWEWAAGVNGDSPRWDIGLGTDGPRCWELWPTHCCTGRVGDANGNGNDEPTIGDIAVMIDAKFISGSCAYTIACLFEADINQSGGYYPTCDDITISDISMLIAYLFIDSDGILPNCLY